MKKTILATLLAAVSMSTLAADYFVVVPVPNRTATTGNITVALNQYSLPRAIAGRPYAGFDFAALLQVKGDPAFNPAGVTWSVAGGALPAGMALSRDGKLTGAPTVAGTSAFQVLALYKTKAGQLGYQVVVGEVTVALAAGELPAGVQGAAYFYDIKPHLAVTGDPAYGPTAVIWNFVGELPPGLQLNTNGTITGVPTAEGTHPITVRATYLNKTGQQTYDVIVGAITVGLASAALPAGVQGKAYSFDLKPQLSISGDAAFAGSGVTWSVASGALPAGLTLGADGVITGTPTTENASVPFTIQAAYKTKAGQQAYAVLVGAIQVTLSATIAPPPGATYGRAYNTSGWDAKLNVSIAGDAAYDGKATGVTWSVTGGALPPGLTLSASGVVTGTPTARGTNPVQLKAEYKGKSATQSYTIAYTAGVAQYSGYRAWSDGTLARSCKDYISGTVGYAYSGATGDGIYRIDVDGAGGLTPVDVVCDMSTDGGGWTVFQLRINGSVDFYRTYADYAAGFGNTANYWLGNDRIAALTASGTAMRVDIKRDSGQSYFAQYTGFKVGPATDGYRLGLTWVTGTAGDSLTYHKGSQFSAKDVDQDTWLNNCAQVYHGAWWYKDCHMSNLNANYYGGSYATDADGMDWSTLGGHSESMTRTEMKLR